jgi:hypothetical protein
MGLIMDVQQISQIDPLGAAEQRQRMAELLRNNQVMPQQAKENNASGAMSLLGSLGAAGIKKYGKSNDAAQEYNDEFGKFDPAFGATMNAPTNVANQPSFFDNVGNTFAGWFR